MAIKYYSDSDVKIPNFRRREVNNWIKEVAESYDKVVGDITYQFCSDERILELNQKYLGHDYYTDILTFNQNVDNVLIADILISLDTVTSNADKYEQPFEVEFLRVVIHGILHLCGEDDHSEEEIASMRAAENKALQMIMPQMDYIWRK